MDSSWDQKERHKLTYEWSRHGSIPINSGTRKHVDEKDLAAMLATNMPAGVTPEVNLRNPLCAIEMHTSNESTLALDFRPDIIESPK